MNRLKNLLPMLAALAAISTTSADQAVAQDVAIKGATIVTMTGERIENGVIIVRDGKIAKVGADLKVPVEATVIDAEGKVVMPGIVDVHSSAGMSQANENNDTVPFLSVIDSIDPKRPYFEESLRNGVTSAAVVPGNSTMIGGRAAVVKTAGSYVDDMILKRDVALKISMAPRSGSRLSHYTKLRKTLEDVKEAQKKREEKEEEDAKAKAEAEKKKAEDKKKEGDKKAETKKPAAKAPAAESVTAQATREAMESLLAGKLPAYIYCSEAMDVTNAIRLVEEFKLKPIYVVGPATYKAAKALAETKAPVILDSRLVSWRTDPRTREDEKIVLTKIFSDAGCKFLMQADDRRTGLGSHYHWYQAATAVKYGMSEEDALKALTIDAAKALGIDEFVGSIEAGKDADLVILSGDPLKVATWVETTIVGGEVAYEKAKDERLRLLFEPEKDAN
jgi:imidazolonepropionase-like amidohydrolase